MKRINEKATNVPSESVSFRVSSVSLHRVLLKQRKVYVFLSVHNHTKYIVTD